MRPGAVLLVYVINMYFFADSCSFHWSAYISACHACMNKKLFLYKKNMFSINLQKSPTYFRTVVRLFKEITTN